MTDPLLGRRIGNIRILDRLAQGGMGALYLGLDEKLGRKVAVKGLRRGKNRDPQVRAKFLREARILSQIRHPNICQIYDFLAGDDRDFLVLELIEGRTLREVLKDDPDERTRLWIATEIARVLVAIHAEGVIHRDLKPANVMLTPADEIKVLDFGIARLADLEAEEAEHRPAPLDRAASESALLRFSRERAEQLETRPGNLPGTPHFMSPEQARGEPLTIASDMYSFGLLLQELLTGHPPYEAGIPVFHILLRATKGESRPVEGLDAESTRLIERLKSSVPTARPTAIDTLERLERIRDRPRRRAQRIAFGAAVILLVILATIMAFLARSAEKQRRKAEAQTRLALSRQLTAQASNLLDGELDRALLLSLEAIHHADTLDARTSLLAGLGASPRLKKILRSPQPRSNRVAWSPDGRFLATCSRGEVYLWNRSGELVRTLSDGDLWIWEIAWSPDSQMLVTAGEDSYLKRWDVTTQKILDPPLEGHEGDIWSVAWRPGSDTFTSAAEDTTLRFWDGSSGRPGEVVELPGDIWAIAWNPDGRRLAIVYNDHFLVVRDAETGALSDPWQADAWIWALEWSPEGRTLALGVGEDIVLLDGQTFKPRLGPFEGHDGTVMDLAWDEDGKTLFTAGADATIRRFNPTTGEAAGHPLTGHADEILSIDWSPDGRLLASGSVDRAVHLWDMLDKPSLIGPLSGHASWVVHIAWSHDGRFLASSGIDETARIWNTVNGELLHTLRGHTKGVWAVAWNPDDSLLATGSEDHSIRLWDTRTGLPEGEPLLGHTDEITRLLWSADGILFSASKDGTIRRWDMAAGAEMGVPLAGHQASIRALAFAPDGTRLASGDGDGTLHFWDPETGEAVEPTIQAHDEWILDIAWRPDGTAIASASRDQTIRLWDTESGAALRDIPLRGHTAEVRSVTWRDNRILLSGGRDHTILLWDTATGQPVGRLRDHDSGILYLAMQPNGPLLASASADETVRIRDVSGDLEDWKRRACTRAQRNLTAEEWELFLGADIPWHKTCPDEPTPGAPAESPP